MDRRRNRSRLAGTASSLSRPRVFTKIGSATTFSPARSRAAVGGDAERAQLARDLTNQSDDEARDTIARQPGVSSATIDYRTWIFPQRMPWLASHITVQVAER